MDEQLNNLKSGDEIKFSEDRLWFKVVGKNERFVIAITKKVYNANIRNKTWYYTIIDTVENIRGRVNLIFELYDFEKQSDIDKVLSELGPQGCHENKEKGYWEESELAISSRNCISANILKIKAA